MVEDGREGLREGKIRIAKGIKDRDALVHELKNYSRTTNIATGNMAFRAVARV
jgi:hypothetical protein